MNVRTTRTRARGGARLDRIPGSGSPLELVRLVRDPIRFFHERFARHGRVFRTRIVVPAVFVVGADANRALLVTERSSLSFGGGYALTAVRHIFEGSIMVMEGAAHDEARALLTPAVGKLAVRESADAVRHLWDTAAAGLGVDRAHDAYDVAEKATFAVAANVLTGLELGRETERVRPHFERLIDGLTGVMPVPLPFSALARGLAARHGLIRMLRPRIDRARRTAPHGLLGQLAHHVDDRGRPLDADAIAAHLLLLFWAGYDTTASAGAWILHVLARRPDWQDRLRRERLAVLGDAPLDADSGRLLPKMGWFLKEIERLYPSALFFPRVTLEDWTVEGHTIPRGTLTCYSPYLSHRDPASFDQPNAFEPMRWDPDRKGGRPRPSLLVGFGGGPRVCLGKAFAQLQLRIAIDAVLSRWWLEPDPTCRPRIQGVPVHHPKGSRFRVTPV